jgi:glutaredoxin 3
MNVVVYTKSGCVNCRVAKDILNSKGIGYDEWDVEKAPEVLVRLLAKHPEARQMPQIFINGHRVGGLAGLQAALKQVGL